MRELLTIAEYSAELAALLTPISAVEQVPLGSAAGRVLGAPTVATVSIPVFTNSAMDGYAVRHSDLTSTPCRLRVIAEIAAGSGSNPAAGPGQCVRIMTGAQLPDFADTVIPVEDTDGGTEFVQIESVRELGQHVRHAGEDFAAGALVATAGMELTPARLGTLAAVGLTELTVRARPRVAVCSTGDELVTDGGALARGQIYESNSVALAAALERDGALVLRGGTLPDVPDALKRWLDDTTADLILLTGGASVGAFDVVRDVLTEAGGQFRHVRMQPGKPQGWARWGEVPVLSLPGNPLSAMLSYEVLVRPLLDRMLDRPTRPNWTAVAAAGWTSPAGRAQLVPVRVTSGAGGTLLVQPAHQRGSASHLVTSLAEADGFCVVPEGVTAVSPGDLVELRLL